MNEYLGVKAEKLEKLLADALRQKEYLNDLIESVSKEAQIKIEKYQKAIESIDKTMKKIEEALRYTPTNGLEYVNIIQVDKITHSIPTGEKARYVGDFSCYKDKKYYYFRVKSINDLDNRIDSNLTSLSREYAMSEKKELTKDLLKAVIQYDIHRIEIDKEVSIATKVFKDKGIEIVTV